MQEYLMFQLFGVMSSWGEIAVGQMRASANHPSRSALIGLLAAALGIDRDDQERQIMLAESLQFAVRLDSVPVLIRDFHTAQTIPEKDLKKRSIGSRKEELEAGKHNTILSSREYFNDAVYSIAAWINPKSKPLFSLNEIQSALSKPHYTLYLGRKSCVSALPMQAQIVIEKDLFTAYQNTQFNRDFLEASNISTVSEYLYWWEDTENSGIDKEKVLMTFTRRDDPRSRIQWQFGERFEHHTILPVTETLQEETQ